MQRHFTRSVLGVFVLLLSLWNTAQADLVAHWQFENNPNDASGNGLNGVPHGSATYVADGRIGSALSLSNASGGAYFSVANNALLNFGTSSFTIATHFKVNGAPGYLFGKGSYFYSSSSGIGYAALASITSGGHRFVTYYNEGYGEHKNYCNHPESMFTDGKWHHYAMVVDRSNQLLTVYLDGMVAYTSSDISGIGSFDSSSDFMIGKPGDHNFVYWNGMIDDFRIYNEALSATDVAKLSDFPTDLLIGNSDPRGTVLRPNDFNLTQPGADWKNQADARFVYDSLASSYRFELDYDNITRGMWGKQAVSIQPNRRYILAAVVKTDFVRSENEMTLGVQYLDSNGDAISGGRYSGLPAKTNAGAGGWERWEWTFVSRSNDDNAVSGRLYCKALGGDSGSSISLRMADWALIELPADSLTPFAPGEGVTFDGNAGDLDMAVLSVVEDENDIIVVTTGARYVFSKLHSTIRMEQRLGMKRHLATWTSSLSLAGLTVLERDDQKCILGNANVTFGVQMDSLLGMVPHNELEMTLENALGGDFNRYNEISGDILSEDDFGGFTVNPYIPRGTGRLPRVQVLSPSTLAFTTLDRTDVDATGAESPGWRMKWTMSPGERLFASVFPVRPYDWEESFDFQWFLTSFDKDMDWYAPGTFFGFINHWLLWDFNECPGGMSSGTQYVARDEEVLSDHIDEIHAQGDKAFSYFSAWFYRDRDAAQWLAEVQRWRDNYGIDGIYSDGLPQDDWIVAYEQVRGLRERFPSGPIVIHDSLLQSNMASAEFRPFLHAYASATYMAEGTETSEDEDWNWPRYVTSQFRKANCMGNIKGDKWDDNLSQAIDKDFINLIYNGRARAGTTGFKPYYLDALTDLKTLWNTYGEDSCFYDRYYLPEARILTGFALGRMEMPIANIAAVAVGQKQVTLSTWSGGGTIRYTIDGTEPTSYSSAYSSPLTVPDGSVLRAKTFDTSLETSREYLYRVGSVPAYIHLGFEQTSGTAAHNLPGSDFNADLSNMSFEGNAAPGILGRALEFNGVDERLQCSQPLDLGVGDFTLMAWVHADAIEKIGVVELTPASGTTGRVRLGLGNTGRLHYGIYTGSTWLAQEGVGPVLVGGWHHIAVSFDRDGAARAYVDGILVDDALDVSSASSLSIGTTCRVGYDGWTVANYFDGMIDEVKIYKSALSQEAILVALGDLLAYFPLNESTGSTAYDAVDHLHTGALSGGMTFDANSVTGAVGSALSFDGVNDRILLNAISTIGQKDFTLSARVKFSSIPSGHAIGIVTIKHSGSSTARVRFSIKDDGKLRYGLYTSAEGWRETSSGTSLADGQWRHVVVTYDRSGYATGYVDGTPVGSVDISAITAPIQGQVYIGYDDYGGPGSFSGAIDDVRIYNRILTADEIAAAP